MSDTIFGKIIRGEIPAEFIYEDEHCLAIHDANPQAPIHILVLPRKAIAKLGAAEPQDQSLLGHLLLAAATVAKQLGVEDAYRIIINNGAGAGQTVFHLHIHLLAGRPLRWPPG